MIVALLILTAYATIGVWLADQLAEDGDPDGCSPWTCRSGEPIT